ncbi:MAG TPA: DUF4265 domain-containing protein [Roseiflexaceae bacterium]|nr:DUF4265 domain-containing protein [Roseiflexaceae bacterium]
MSDSKILFRLKQDDDGYPPVSYESVWAAQQGTHYQIDNIPFFTREATCDDVVEATVVDGELWFVRVVQYSRSSLLRAVYFDGTDQAAVRAELERLGCSTEWAQQFRLIAISVPNDVAIEPVLEYLKREEEQGRLSYEEAVIWY